MASKVRLLDHNQGLNEKAREHLKKSIVLMLVRRAQADWIIHNVLAKRREPREAHSMLDSKPPLEVKVYIPDVMPPLEIPNTYFEPPGRHRLVAATQVLKTFKDRAYPEPSITA